jgi:hypothetical protein
MTRSVVESFLGETVHLPDRLEWGRALSKHLTIIHLRMARKQNGGSGAEAADRAFL